MGIQRAHVEDTVYAAILNGIKSGKWTIGEKIPSEAVLCKALQVSRSSVRSAVQRLRALGLVEVRHGKGTYVVGTDGQFLHVGLDRDLNLTEKEFNDITEFREAVEKGAINLLAQAGTDANLTLLEQAYLAMRRAAEQNDPEEYSRQDCLFHLAILTATQNDLIIQIANIIKDQYRTYFFELNKFLFEENDGNIKALFDPNDPADLHTMVYEYLCKGNTACAQTVMNRIISNNKKRFAAYLKEKEGSRDG